MMQMAYANGYLLDYRQQTRNYEQEMRQSKERIGSLVKLNEKLASENATLHKLFPDANKRKGS
jgi:hypothetical protein